MATEFPPRFYSGSIGGAATGYAVAGASATGFVIPATTGDAVIGGGPPNIVWPDWANQREPREYKIEITASVGVTNNIIPLPGTKRRTLEDVLTEWFPDIRDFYFWSGLLITLLLDIIVMAVWAT